jgi:hypothetical protein
VLAGLLVAWACECPHAMGFYNAVGFTSCGVASTEFGQAPRIVLLIQ